MTYGDLNRCRRGFSLVELLVVMVIMGLVMTSVYGLYIANQRTAYTQEEVVELQQNLRIAMDWVARDIRMSGFMVPKDQFPVDVATNNSLTLHTASPSGRFAVVRDDFPLVANLNETQQEIFIEEPEMVDFFDATVYNSVRIIRPPSHSEPDPSSLEVTAIDRDNSNSNANPSITVSGFSTPVVQFKAGDVIVYTTGNHPQDITYAVSSENILTRGLNGTSTPEEVAEYVTDVDFLYLLDNGSWSSDVTGDNRDDIRAVSVKLTGQVDTLEGTKTRQISSVISIRNR